MVVHSSWFFNLLLLLPPLFCSKIPPIFIWNNNGDLSLSLTLFESFFDAKKEREKKTEKTKNDSYFFLRPKTTTTQKGPSPAAYLFLLLLLLLCNRRGERTDGRTDRECEDWQRLRPLLLRRSSSDG